MIEPTGDGGEAERNRRAFVVNGTDVYLVRDAEGGVAEANGRGSVQELRGTGRHETPTVAGNGYRHRPHVAEVLEARDRRGETFSQALAGNARVVADIDDGI